MLRFFNKHLKIQSEGNLSLSEKKQSKLLNRINLIFAFLALMSGVFLYTIAAPGSKLILLMTGIFLSLTLLFSVYLNCNSRFKIAKYLTLFTLLAIVTGIAVMFGKNSKVEYFYLFAAALSLVLFSDKRLVLIFWIAHLLLFIFAIWYMNTYAPVLERPDPPAAVVHYFIPVLVFVLLTLFIRIFITENIKIESELQKQNKIIRTQSEELKKNDELKSKLYTDISHEIKTPLTLISGPLQDLYKSEKDHEKKEILDLVLKNSEHLLRLTNQILKLSQLDSGKLELNIEEFDLIKVTDLCASIYSYTALKQKKSFKIMNDYPNLIVSADQEQIHTILNNLLSNAFKYTDEGGTVSLMIKRLNENHVEISVNDTGKGILPEDLPKIFDRFYRTGNLPSGNTNGSGLGLELTKRLVELHGGQIDVKSEIGKGTIFIITLPIVSKDSVPVNITETPDEKEKIVEILNSDKKLVLIAEDNPDMLGFLTGLLSKTYTVIQAQNGDIAYKKTLDYIPDIIISDVMMPVMDGTEFCKNIRNNQKVMHIPIILLTAKHFRKDKMIGLESGADHYIEKPFNNDELKLVISNLIKRQDQIAAFYSKKVFFPDHFLIPESEDEKFLKKLTIIVEQNIDNAEFNVNDLSGEVAYSRSQLYRKTMALTNTSPNEFIRNIRLKRAAALLKNKTGNISEVCYAVGFNKPSYFSECFRSLYNCTPSEFIDDNQAG
jgi:signal transduction histidine kinase/DNA-binding response OmpR family regulator